MLERVDVTVNEDKASADLPVAPFDLVWVTMRDGRELRHDPVEHARGSWQLQLERSELAEKFNECAGLFLPQAKVGPLFEKLYNIEKITDLRDLHLI